MIDIVVGLQYGDEGKGKIVDYLAKDYDITARYQGGSNAGHTIYLENDEKRVLHNIPSGILRGCTSVITHGCVINPEELLEEISTIMMNPSHSGLGKLFISDRCHVITSEHLKEDKQNVKTFGSTGKGIGPAFRDKVNRCGILLGDVIDDYPDLKPYVIDTRKFLYDNYLDGYKILFEGAQAVGLDIDMGTYPYVTSSPCTANYVPQGSGLPLSFFYDTSVVGVVKAYMSRVAVGPFVSEMDPVTAHIIREVGKEYGATTGRPRRIGWLDLEQLSEACDINGVTSLALTRMDTLGILSNVKVRSVGGKYINFEGWSYGGEMKFHELDFRMRKYIDYIEDSLGLPVSLIGVGPRRDHIIER